MANLMAAIAQVMKDWEAQDLTNRQAYLKIATLILDFQKADWADSHGE